MGQGQFAALMQYICSDLVAVICEKKNVTADEAIE